MGIARFPKKFQEFAGNIIKGAASDSFPIIPPPVVPPAASSIPSSPCSPSNTPHSASGNHEVGGAIHDTCLFLPLLIAAQRRKRRSEDTAAAVLS
ncbi:hypothetical protein EON64_11385 [archaeon]|nr:MAG: hypothetical protein EON64_11385 [archaeon]